MPTDHLALALARESATRLDEAPVGVIIRHGRTPVRRDADPPDTYSVWSPRRGPCEQPDWTGLTAAAALDLIAADRARTLIEDRYA